MMEEVKRSEDEMNLELSNECIICSETLDLKVIRQNFLQEKLFPKMDDNKGKKNF